MIWLIGVTQAILGALRLVVSKVVFEKKIFGPDFQTLFSRVIHINILLLFFLFGLSNYDMSYKSISLGEWGLFILSSLFLYANYYLKINAYSNEKISTLQPFAMLVQVFPIIFGFIFLASERASLTTFIMALLASFIVIGASIDHKKLKINKYSLMVLFGSLIQSIQIFFIVYLLTKIGPTDLYFTESIILIIISVLFIFLKKEFGKIKFLTKKYFSLLCLSNTISIGYIILMLTLYSKIGVVATSLISLLYLAFVYLFSYIILKEIPKKKDIIISFLVVVCIIIGTYFRG